MTKNKIKIKLVHSAIGCPQNQKDTVRGLGFTKLNQVREVVDSQASRGMINKVSHLVKIIAQ